NGNRCQAEFGQCSDEVSHGATPSPFANCWKTSTHALASTPAPRPYCKRYQFGRYSRRPTMSTFSSQWPFLRAIGRPETFARTARKTLVMGVTLRDVARAARVSISTASRALSGKALANRKTALRVRRIADELGYRPNTLARGLKTRSSRLVGLVLHNLMNASFGVLAEIVQKRLSGRGY